MTKRLALSTEAESKAYELSSCRSGLPRDLNYLHKDPLARSSLGRPSRYDAIHLSVADADPSLVQWWGRGGTGYYYPIGPVMKMVDG